MSRLDNDKVFQSFVTDHTADSLSEISLKDLIDKNFPMAERKSRFSDLVFDPIYEDFYDYDDADCWF